jgi:hypothetical protein
MFDRNDPYAAVLIKRAILSAHNIVVAIPAVTLKRRTDLLPRATP